VSGAAQNVRVVGRYALYGAIAAGGMATIHLGRLLGPVGFSRTVAIKRLHAQFAADPEFVSMFLDEARLAARIRHPNVVPTLDVVATSGELFLVMEYVPGDSLSRLSRVIRERNQGLPLRVLSAIITGVLHGLHAAHEAKDERGHPLGIVHRDVSPQNVLVGADGVARVLDFGVAKAAGRVQTTKEGHIKGKLSYMPPEQLKGAAVNRQSDIYAAGVMLWELVTGQRLFAGDNEGAIVAKILEGRVQAPSMVLARSGRTMPLQGGMAILQALDETILRALAMEPERRFATSREMALEIERRCPPATASEVGDWVESIAKDVLSSRAAMIADIESGAPAIEKPDDHVANVLGAKSELGPTMPAPTAAEVNATRVATVPMAGGTPSSVPRASHPTPFDGPPVTQPSSISVASGNQKPRDTSSARRTVVAALVGTMLGASVLATAVVYRYTQRHAPNVEATSAPIDPILVPQSSAGAVPIGSSSSAAAEVDASVASVTSADAAPPPPSASTPKPAKPVKPVVRPPPPAPAPDDCNPPFYFENKDGQPIKKYKPQCLNR
jgi:serine/threonine-protein kinase